MRVRDGVRFCSLLCLVFGANLAALSAGGAQTPGELRGSVTDTAGVPIYGAIVTVAGGSSASRTNDRGEFSIRGVPAGPAEIAVRRLGFFPLKKSVQARAPQGGGDHDFRLSPLPTSVRPVVVEARHVEYSGRLAGYYERLHRRAGGQFIDRTVIDRQNSRTLSQLLSQFPGMSAVSFRNGQSSVRMRGRACRPLVWLDGVPMPAAEVDLNAFPLSTLHGIELYLGSTSAPFDYTASQGMSSCGTILLWSRGRDTEPAMRPAAPLLDLEEMAASLSVLTAARVDTPAEVLTPSPLPAVYPASLYAAGVAGSAVAEFVVDERGAIEPGTFAIVSATHPLFAESVTRALEGATYSPAIKSGVRVRQIVHQHFVFSPSGRLGRVGAVSER